MSEHSNYSTCTQDHARNRDLDLEKISDERELLAPDVLAALDQLDDDDKAAIEELDQAPDQVVDQDKPSGAMRRLARLVGHQKAVRLERHRLQELVFKEAEAAAVARIRADRKRAKEAEGQQRHRASKDVQNQKALERLLRATANPKGDKQLEQLRGNEVAYTRFYGEFREAREREPKVSGAQLRDRYNDAWGENISRDTAIRWRRICLDLEAKGGPWFVRQGPTKRAT